MKTLRLLAFLSALLPVVAHAQMSGADMYNPASATTSGSSGVSSVTCDGTLLSCATTGAITLTTTNAPAYSFWGNATGSTAAPGYTNSPEVLNLTTSGTLSVLGNAALAGTTTISTAQILAGNALLTTLTATNIEGTSMALSGTATIGTLEVTTNAALAGTTTLATAQIAAGNATLTNLTATTVTGTTGNFPTLNATNALVTTITATTENLGGVLKFTTTAAAPAAPFTGIYSNAVNALVAVTSGTNALYITSTQSFGMGESPIVGIGSTFPTLTIKTNPTTGNGLVIDDSNNAAALELNETGTGGNSWVIGTASTGGGLAGQFYFNNQSISGGTATPFALSVSSATAGAKFALVSGGVYCWSSAAQYANTSTCDTGISRDGAGVIDIGSGTAANKSGSINLTALTATATIATSTTLKQGTELSCSTGLTTDGSGNINGCVASDPSQKRDIGNLEYDPSIVEKLSAITYKWLDTSKYDDKSHIGFNAKEVYAVDPRLTKSAGNGLLGIDNSAMDAVIISDLHALHKEIDQIPAIENDACHNFNWLGRELFCQ